MREEEFKLRTVTFVSDDSKIKVTRVRNSHGYASIKVSVGNEQILDFNNDDENRGYEQEATELAKLLDRAVCHPCGLDD